MTSAEVATAITAVEPPSESLQSTTITTSNTNPKSEEMVAAIFTTSTGTPPQSPHRGAGSNGHQPFTISNQYMVQQPSPSTTKKSPKSNNNHKSPKTSRRASYHSGSEAQTSKLSPKAGSSTGRRASMPSGSPSHSNPINNNINNSPIPLGNRLQPATATAPVVGRHEKKDLAGFDPLASGSGGGGGVLASPPRLNNSNHGSGAGAGAGEISLTALMQQREPTTPTSSKEPVIPASLSNLTLSPPKSPSANNKNDPELTKELRKLAHEMSAASPHRPSKAEAIPKGSKSKKNGGRAGSLTPKFNLTPPFRANDKLGMSASGHTTREPLSAPHRKLPWQRHRRSKSLETPNAGGGGGGGGGAPPATTTRTDSFENDATKANRGNNHNMSNSPITPMMQDLYDVVKAQQNQPGTGSTTVSLALPNLYKPAPTSFLTGTEMVRSSEQDPSPFQMEIPSLDQTLVAARSVQFVDVYRKEDMNFDMNALVGLPRMAMRNFVENADSPALNNRVTQAHRPVVESLLEAADDIMVAGFFATENAGSADIRREAVILERQMQFVVVFRGTTQEQTGKTAIFKKKDKHQQKASAMEPLSNDNVNCKVYTSVKQAYMELEQKVFDCLDKFLDQNPFCDVVFTGSSLGGAMATLGAYRYASNRPVVRVCCQTFGAPKVGNKGFRQQANSLPNLKVMRIEYGNDPKCYAPHDSNGAHVGHAILLSKNSNNEGSNKTLSAVACKFDNHDNRKHNTSKSAALLATFKKERDITSYVSHLEQLHQSKINKWVKDFAGEDGTGVRGKDNEQRQVV